MSAADFRKFLACVLIWGTTWLAITFQLGSVAPEASVAWRFGLAAALLAAYCRWRGFALRFPWAIHRQLAGMGLTMFTAAYLCIYFAETYVVSGLVAVGYCLSPMSNQFASRLAFGTALSWRVSVGGLLGLLGVVCVFWPELQRLEASRAVLLGALLTAGGVLASTIGNVFASRLQNQGVNVWQKMTWGMAYGALGCLLAALLRGQPLGFEPTAAYVLSLLYLSLFGSIVTFAYFLTLLETIGAGRAGYIGVMVPMVALLLSALFEGYAWAPLTFLGLAAALAGNVLILLPARRRSGVSS